MDADDLRVWFDEYLDAFAGCARRDLELPSLLGFYGVPLSVTTDEGVVTLTSDDQVASVIQGQVDALHAQGYDTTKVLAFEASVLNASSALLRTALSRRDAKGDELNTIAMTYLVTERPAGRRISVMAVHSGS